MWRKPYGGANLSSIATIPLSILDALQSTMAWESFHGQRAKGDEMLAPRHSSFVLPLPAFHLVGLLSAWLQVRHVEE